MWLLYIALSVGLASAALDDNIDYPTGSCFCIEPSRRDVNVRSSPSLSGSVVGSAQLDQCFWYMGGKSSADGYTWYSINYKWDGVPSWAEGDFFDNMPTSRCSSIDCGIDDYKLEDSVARNMLLDQNIEVVSSGDCIDRNLPYCTSLEQIRCQDIRDIIWLQVQSAFCTIIVTGGTETGHADGEYSHWNGYKLDISMRNDCINDYIRTFGLAGTSPYYTYYDSKGNRYWDEYNHWDITYRDHLG